MIFKKELFVVFITAITIELVFVDGVDTDVAESSSSDQRIYAVVIDAGSTASRISAFIFQKSAENPFGLKLVDQLFSYLEPGLSHYKTTPKEGAAVIKVLLDGVLKEISNEDQIKTPVVVRATAGLRVLPDEQSNQLLEAVREVVYNTSLLKLGDRKDVVSIMEGEDEAFHSWFTVNFLHGNLDRSVNKPTVATLDLGGGSIQLTFLPNMAETKIPSKLLHSVSVMGKKFDLYTASYTGLGLVQAEYKIFRAENSNKESKTLVSSCLHPSAKDVEFKHDSNSYSVSGKPGNTNVFESCSKIVKTILENEKIDKLPDEVLKQEIMAFSYFYDKATQSNIVDSNNGGIAKLEDFTTTAQQYCSSENLNQVMMCLDLTFMSHLLEYGFGFKRSTPIRINRYIGKFGVSWTLGAAFSLLEKVL